MAAPSITTADIIARGRSRADMEDSDFITAADEVAFSEAAWREFYGIIVTKAEDYFVISTSLSVVANTAEYNLPTDFRRWKILLDDQGNALRRANFRDLEAIQGNTSARGRPTHYLRYSDPRSAGHHKVRLLKTPSAAQTMTLYYVPNMSLADATGSAGLNFVAGWDEYLVLTFAIKCKDKEESDVWVLMQERKALLDNIIAGLLPIDEGEPPTVQQIAGMGWDPSRDPFDYEDGGG